MSGNLVRIDSDQLRTPSPPTLTPAQLEFARVLGDALAERWTSEPNSAPALQPHATPTEKSITPPGPKKS